MNQTEVIGKLLADAKTVAVVGCSPKTERASHRVAAYLQRVGYRMIPVNPGQNEILGERCYSSLADIPKEVIVDIVDVFRRSETVPPITEAAIERGTRALWLQIGVIHPEAERQAAEAGLIVVSDRCIKIEHAARF